MITLKQLTMHEEEIVEGKKSKDNVFDNENKHRDKVGHDKWMPIGKDQFGIFRRELDYFEKTYQRRMKCPKCGSDFSYRKHLQPYNVGLTPTKGDEKVWVWRGKCRHCDADLGVINEDTDEHLKNLGKHGFFRDDFKTKEGMETLMAHDPDGSALDAAHSYFKKKGYHNTENKTWEHANQTWRHFEHLGDPTDRLTILHDKKDQTTEVMFHNHPNKTRI